MSIIIRLQNLPWTANAEDIRQFFHDSTIPEGGVHIVGGEHGDAFIVFGSDEDARLAMRRDGETIKDVKVKLLLSSRVEMQKVIELAKQQALNPQNIMQTLVGVANPAAAAAASAIPMNVLFHAIPALRNLSGLTGLPTLPAMPGLPTMSFPGVTTTSPFPGVTTTTAASAAAATVASDPRHTIDANKMMPLNVPKAPSIQSSTKKSDNKYGGGSASGQIRTVRSQSRSRSRSTSPLKSRDWKNRNAGGRYDDEGGLRDRKWKRDRSRSRNRDKRSSRSRSPRDRYRRRSRSHERKSRSDTKYDSWSKETQQQQQSLPHSSLKNRQNVVNDETAAASSSNASKRQDFDSRFSNRLMTAANFANNYASSSSTGDDANLGNENGARTNALKSNESPKNTNAEGNANAKMWLPNARQPSNMPWMNDPSKLLINSGVLDAQKAFKEMMEAKPNVPPMSMFPFVGGIPPPAAGLFPFGGMPPQGAAGLPTTLQNNLPLPPVMPLNSFGQFQHVTQPSPSPNVMTNSNENTTKKSFGKAPPIKINTPPELDENEVDCFGRMRRKRTNRNESYSPPDTRFEADRSYGRRDNRASRDSTFKKDFSHANNNFQNEDNRGSYDSQEDFSRRGPYRRHFEKRDNDDVRDTFRGGNDDERGDSFRRNNEFRRGDSGFRGGFDDRRNGFRGGNNDDARRNANNSGSTCIELRNVPCEADENDIKNFFEPIPVYDSCIKFAPCAEEGARTRNVLIKFSLASQRADALKYRGKTIKGCRVRVYETINDVWEASENVQIGQVRQPYIKISFIPKRAVREDVLSAFSVEPVDFVITKPKNRASLTAYLKFPSVEPIEEAMSNKHKIYICGGRVKVEVIDETQFDEAKREIEEETADDDCIAVELPKRRRFDDENAEERRRSFEESSSDMYYALIKNLPTDVTDKDILDFFADVNAFPSRIHILYDSDGEQTGEAFCEFNKEIGLDNALTKNGNIFRDDEVTIMSVTEDEMRRAIGIPSNYQNSGFGQRSGSSYSARGNAGSGNFRSRGFHHNRSTTTRQNANRGTDLTQVSGLDSFGQPGCVVSLENVPYKADVEDILEFFDDYNITRESVIRRFNDKGLPTGDARVSLESPTEASRALKELDGKKIRERRVYVKMVS